MKIKSCFVCLLAMFLCGISAAHAAPSFLKVGSWYNLQAHKDTLLLAEGGNDLSSLGAILATVKIVELGSGEWCRVEYDQVIPAANGQPVTINRCREWLNFSFVTNATLSGAPDYKTACPAGFKVVLQYK
jgi:hypothetical protein